MFWFNYSLNINQEHIRLIDVLTICVYLTKQQLLNINSHFYMNKMLAQYLIVDFLLFSYYIIW